MGEYENEKLDPAGFIVKTIIMNIKPFGHLLTLKHLTA